MTEDQTPQQPTAAVPAESAPAQPQPAPGQSGSEYAHQSVPAQAWQRPIDQEPPEGYQAAYVKAAKRSKMLLISTIVLGAATVFLGFLVLGLGAWGISQAGDSGPSSRVGAHIRQEMREDMRDFDDDDFGGRSGPGAQSQRGQRMAPNAPSAAPSAAPSVIPTPTPTTPTG